MAPPGQMAHTAKWPKKGQKPVKMTQKQLFLTLLTTFWHPGPEGSDPETHDPRVPNDPSDRWFWPFSPPKPGQEGPSQPEGSQGVSEYGCTGQEGSGPDLTPHSMTPFGGVRNRGHLDPPNP